jgi:uncharacterized protein (TIGR03437 family)
LFKKRDFLGVWCTKKDVEYFFPRATDGIRKDGIALLLMLSLTRSLRLILCAIWIGTFALGQVNVLTANYDNQRTNANLQETTLKPSNVSSATFGKIASVSVDGQIYAQPLYATGVQILGAKHNVVYVATMHNSVYAIDADAPQASGVLWQLNLGPSVPSTMFQDFDDISPEIGILSTPVIDVSRQVMYLVSETVDASQTPVFKLHALLLANGREVMNGPVTIAASVPGTGAASDNGTIAFDAMMQLQRPGLALANGAVYLAFGSHGDSDDFHGWLMSYDTSNLQRRISVLNTTPDGWGGAIWQAGRAPAIDDLGNLYVATGNGDFDGSTNFGESLLRLSGTDLKPLDWYTPEDWNDLNDKDWDFGSVGAILLPNTNLVLTGAKSGTLCLIRRDSMGHLQPYETGTAQAVEVNQWGMFNLALWNNQNGPIVYLLEPYGPLKAFQIVNGRINSAMLSSYTPSSSTFYAGIAVSATGGANGTGIVWLTTGDTTAAGGPGTLHALDASNLSHELWNSDMLAARDALGRAAKFVAPTVANGRVYVPTFSKTLAVFGLLSNTVPTGGPVSSQITAVVNGANFAATAVSPGELVAIFGKNLGPSQLIHSQVDSNSQVGATLAGTQLLFSGIRAPLLYVSANQVGAVVPFGLPGPNTQVQVLYQSVPSSSTTVPVIPATPALFSIDGTGTGSGAILNQDGSLNSADNPAAPGSVVILYATGAGNLKPSASDGSVIGTPPFPRPVLPVTVFIGKQTAEVLYAGAAPGMVAGVLQMNVRIPDTTPPGSSVPVAFMVGNYSSSNSVTLAVQ